MHDRWFLGILALCAAFGPAVAQTYSEEASARGMTYVTASQATYGRGVAFSDLDGDGDPDVVLLGRADGIVGVYENDGAGQFTDRSGISQIPAMVLASGIAAADYDGDGDLDLYVSCQLERNVLLRNDGGWQFTDVTTAAGVGDTGAGQGASWGDYDGDGWLDLYVSNHTEADSVNRLYRNQGDGTFVESALALGVDRSGDPTFQSVFFDYNGDMQSDLYVCNDHGVGCTPYTNHLFENTGGAYQNVTGSSGTEACVGCMGTGVGDFDANGFQDLYCTNIPLGNVLLLNQGDGSFEESADALGVSSYATGWGNLMLDHDNDGWLDIYVCNTDAPNRLYECNGGALQLSEVGAAVGVATPQPSFTASAADIEGDGDLDLLVQGPGQPIRLYVNSLNGASNWLQVKLQGAAPNTHAVGAKVRVTTGQHTQLREVAAGIGFKSSGPAVLHFGLGSASWIDQLVIEWPDGTQDTVVGVAANQKLVRQQPAQTAPPPVADGVSGVGLRLGRGPGDLLQVSFDAATCGSDHAVLLWGQIGDFSEYAGAAGAGCDVGNTGTAAVDFPAAGAWFNLIWVDASARAGHPGYGSSGPRDWSPTGLCDIETWDAGDPVCD